MRLQHLHLQKPISYAYSLQLQEALLERQFSYKTALRNDSKTTAPAPPPTLLTFQTHPTYTVGRRHLRDNPLSESQIHFLTGAQSSPGDTQKDVAHTAQQPATFYPSPRGGLLTYHAPGQLTAYLILDLRAHGLTPRCYIRALENTVINTCSAHGVKNVMTTDDPGVWIGEEKKITNKQDSEAQVQPGIDTSSAETAPTETIKYTPTNRKICAVGVHVSRGITSHGIGLNIFDHPIEGAQQSKGLYTLPVQNDHSKPESANGFLSWGFSRIVACGLEGKSVTWLMKEQQRMRAKPRTPRPYQIHKAEREGAMAEQGSALLQTVASTLAQETAKSLNIDADGVERMFEEDLMDRDGVEEGQTRRDWQYLKGLSGKVEDRRVKSHSLNWQIRDTRRDSGLRFH